MTGQKGASVIFQSSIFRMLAVKTIFFFPKVHEKFSILLLELTFCVCGVMFVIFFDGSNLVNVYVILSIVSKEIKLQELKISMALFLILDSGIFFKNYFLIQFSYCWSLPSSSPKFSAFHYVLPSISTMGIFPKSIVLSMECLLTM